MDKEFETAVQQANYRAILANQKEKLKEILQGQLIYSYNGGQFQLGSALFSELRLYLDEDRTQSTVLDMNLNPIRISDLDNFYKDIRSRHTQAINKYSMEVAKLKRSRQIETVVQLDLEDDEEE